MAGSGAPQQGVVLIATLLVLVLGAGLLFVSALAPERVRLATRAADQEVLERARRALIARAAVDANRPGSLRCPDTDDDGVSELAFPCNIMLGRLPWRTLDLPDLRDSAGERLWYALTPALAESNAPLNSGVPGALSLDGNAGLVALILAPGPALGAQSGRALTPNDPGQFLEGENADGDAVFSTAGGGARNDRVLAISIEDLMAPVHKRVLRTLRAALDDYRTRYGAYPWLAPFDDPEVSRFVAQPGVREGLVPVHGSGLVFGTPFTVAWSLSGNTSWSGSVTQAAVENNAVAVTAQSGACSWSVPEAAPQVVPLGDVRCSGQAVLTSGLPPGVATRTVDFDLDYSGTPVIAPPTATTVSSRGVSIAGSMPVVVAAPITIVDRDSGGTETGTGSVVFDGLTSGTLSTFGIHLAPVAAERWFLDNQWERLSYVALAAGYVPGAANSCTPGADCLTVVNGAPPADGKPGVLLLAGADLRGARPSALLGDYLERDNSSPADDVFVYDLTGPTFNDALLVLNP